MHSHLQEQKLLNIPFDHLLFKIAEDRNIVIHPLWDQIALDVSPEYPAASPDAARSSHLAFVVPLQTFFLNSDVLLTNGAREVLLDHDTSDVMPEVKMVAQSIWDQTHTNQVYGTCACNCRLYFEVLFTDSFWCFVSPNMEAI